MQKLVQKSSCMFVNPTEINENTSGRKIAGFVKLKIAIFPELLLLFVIPFLNAQNFIINTVHGLIFRYLLNFSFTKCEKLIFGPRDHEIGNTANCQIIDHFGKSTIYLDDMMFVW